MDILWKQPVETLLARNSTEAVLQNFHTRKLGEITVFYAIFNVEYLIHTVELLIHRQNFYAVGW